MRQGFSLIEMLLVISITATMVSFSVPGMQTIYYQHQLRNAHNQLLSAIRLGQSSQLVRSHAILVCPSSIKPGKQCSTEKDWQQGWLIVQDTNANLKFDSGEELIYSKQLNSKNIRISLNALGIGNKVTFSTNGRLWPNGNFLICHIKLSGHAASIILHSGGRVRSETSSRSNACKT